MSGKENSSRQHSIESGLNQALTPAGLLCGIPEKTSKTVSIILIMYIFVHYLIFHY